MDVIEFEPTDAIESELTEGESLVITSLIHVRFSLMFLMLGNMQKVNIMHATFPKGMDRSSSTNDSFTIIPSLIIRYTELNYIKY